MHSFHLDMVLATPRFPLVRRSLTGNQLKKMKPLPSLFLLRIPEKEKAQRSCRYTCARLEMTMDHQKPSEDFNASHLHQEQPVKHRFLYRPPHLSSSTG